MYLRLAIAAAIILAFLTIGSAALYYRGNAISAAAEAAQARANLAVAQTVIKANEEALGRLRASEAANAKNMAEFVDELEAIHKEMAATTDAVGELKESNADVAAYLRGAVPAPLRKLLDP